LLLVDQSLFFSPNAGGIAFDHNSFRFWISLSILEIFAIEVLICPKSPRILHVFYPKNFWGRTPEFWD